MKLNVAPILVPSTFCLYYLLLYSKDPPKQFVLSAISLFAILPNLLFLVR